MVRVRLGVIDVRIGRLLVHDVLQSHLLYKAL